MLLPTSGSYDDFADRLRTAREEAELTQMELAQKLGKTHQSYVGNFETGVSKAKGLEVVVQFALALNVTVDYLAGLTNEPKGRSKDNLPFGAAEILTEFERLSDVGREEIVEELKRIAAHDAERRADIAQQQAYLYILLDTGIRRQEMADLLLADVDLPTGTVTVRKGKGNKRRTLFLGAHSRRTVMQYLRLHPRLSPSLWVADDGMAINQHGIRAMIRRRSALAGIPEPGLHSFRRAFALNYLRNGGDVMTLQKLLGHASLDIINRYVKLIAADVAAAHKVHGVVDRL